MKKGLLIFFFSTSLFAQTGIQFDQLSTIGTGCPEGTVSSIISPDGKSFSLLFDDFRVEVPNYETTSPAPSPGRGRNYRPPRPTSSIYESHKTCNISFNTTVPVGMKITSISISLQARGNTMLDTGIQGYFTTILVGHRGLANSVGPQAKVIEKKMWLGREEVGEDWITDRLVTVPLNSNCATSAQRSIKFELKNHLEAKMLNQVLTKSGMITIDSNDAQGMLTFAIETTPCR